MIDDKDSTESTLRRILWDALQGYSVEQMLELVLDDDYIVRTSSAKRLQLIGTERIYKKMIQLVEDERSEVREISAFILGQLGTPHKPFKNDSIPILIALSNDEDVDVRAAAIYALGHLGCAGEYTDTVLIDVLKRASIDQSDDIRLSAAFLVSSCKPNADTQDILAKLKGDPNLGVAEYAELSEEIHKDAEIIGAD